MIFRVDAGNGFVVQVETFDDARAEVFDEHVAVFGQLEHRRVALGRLQIEGDGFLVAVDDQPVQWRLGGLDVRPFDLDDFGAHERQRHSRRRPRDKVGEIEDAHIQRVRRRQRRSSVMSCHLWGT